MSFDWRSFDRFGWAVVEKDNLLLEWISEAKKVTKDRISSRNFDREQMRCGGTWFVGMNFLNNDYSGSLNKVTFDGKAVSSILDRYGIFFEHWDKAQVSICYDGYPKPGKSETEASFLYRIKKFGAHVDGILPLGETRRRYAREYHNFIFGIPLVNFNKFAAPVVVWEGSHKIMRRFLSQKLLKNSSKFWKDQDITHLYHEARREVFLHCRKKIIVVPIGGSYILHRLSLHGIMPWGKNGHAEGSNRMIAYFRPLLKEAKFWLEGGM